MVDLLTLFAVLVMCGFGLWFAKRMEPHWSSKDGRRFIARVQVVHPDGSTERWREVRGMVTGDGALLINARGRMGGPLDGIWSVAGKSEDPPRGREIYLLKGTPPLALRIPSRSRAVGVLDELH